MGKASSDCVETTPPLATLTYTVAYWNALCCRLGLHSMATRRPPSSCTNSITGCFARLPSAAAAATALKDASKLFSAAPKRGHRRWRKRHRDGRVVAHVHGGGQRARRRRRRGDTCSARRAALVRGSGTPSRHPGPLDDGSQGDGGCRQTGSTGGQGGAGEAHE